MSGSPVVDIILVIIAIGAMVSGYRQGGFSAVLSLIGVLVGGYVGVTSMPWVLDQVDNLAEQPSDGMRFLAALATITLGVVIGYALGTALGARLRDQIRTKSIFKVESVVGAGVQVITTLTVIWLVLVPLVAGDTSDFGKSVRGSRVLSAVENSAPDFVKNLPTQVSTLINANGFPVITDPFDSVPQREVEAPDSGLAASPEVKGARSSIVRVVGQAEQCRRLLQGSGFAVAPDTVMTNAHVVAGTDMVQLDTVDGMVDAYVTYYNPQQDIALLKVEGYNFNALRWDETDGEQGESAIVLGFPQGGPFKASPARIRDRFLVSGPNIYADNRVEREAYSLRGTVVQGNSGGPLIDEQGQVLGLIFGADVNQEETGYALTRAEVMSHVGDLNKWTQPVETGACVLD